MQSQTTTLSIIDMRQCQTSYADRRNRYGVNNSTITLIMNRFHKSGKDLSALKQMSPSEVENSSIHRITSEETKLRHT